MPVKGSDWSHESHGCHLSVNLRGIQITKDFTTRSEMCVCVAGDGRVTNWTLVKSSLWHHEVIKMNFNIKLDNLGDPSFATCLTDGEQKHVQ
jgi:hypothetical protein